MMYLKELATGIILIANMGTGVYELYISDDEARGLLKELERRYGEQDKGNNQENKREA